MIIKPKIDKLLPYSESIFQILILLGYSNSVIFFVDQFLISL